MPLTCDINDEPEPGEILYRLDHAAPKPVKLNRRKRCSDSRCNAFVSNGDSIISVERFKIPESDIEIRVRGEDGEIDMSPMLLCVDCSWNLVALRDEGYACVFPFEVTDCLKEAERLHIDNIKDAGGRINLTDEIQYEESRQVALGYVAERIKIAEWQVLELVCSKKFPDPVNWTGTQSWEYSVVTDWVVLVAKGVSQEDAAVIATDSYSSLTITRVTGWEREKLQSEINDGKFPKPELVSGIMIWRKAVIRGLFAAIDKGDSWESAAMFSAMMQDKSNS